MGRGNTSSGTYFYAKAINVKKDDKDFPKITLSQKKGDTYEVVDTVSFLTGYIQGLEKVDKTHPTYGRIRGFRFGLHDPDSQETYNFDMGYSGPSRELLNRMASLEDFTEKVKISFYRGDKGFAGTSLRKITINGEEKVELKYGYKEEFEKRIKIVQLNGKDHRDYTELDNFFDALIERKLLTYAKPVFDASAYVPPANTPTPETDSNNFHADSKDDWADLPF